MEEYVVVSFVVISVISKHLVALFTETSKEASLVSTLVILYPFMRSSPPVLTLLFKWYHNCPLDIFKYLAASVVEINSLVSPVSA